MDGFCTGNGRFSVGDGFIRPEVASRCVNGRCLPRITKRANLGTDKSVPTLPRCALMDVTHPKLTNVQTSPRCALMDVTHPKLTNVQTSPRCALMDVTHPKLTNMQTSGRINPSPTKTPANNWYSVRSVGDGFIRPEVTSLCVNGRYLLQIDERANLGTDKSVPYKTPADNWYSVRSVGDGFIRPDLTTLCVNGRCLPQIVERANLGTDKSVPYKNPADNGITYAP
ncbi:MAG: hypothetical protein FWG87_05020 [Defluviitaleaceae bacterium]|nr:hypothetical protein [Defluviitaleaceae bacterium]